MSILILFTATLPKAWTYKFGITICLFSSIATLILVKDFGGADYENYVTKLANLDNEKNSFSILYNKIIGPIVETFGAHVTINLHSIIFLFLMIVVIMIFVPLKYRAAYLIVTLLLPMAFLGSMNQIRQYIIVPLIFMVGLITCSNPTYRSITKQVVIGSIFLTLHYIAIFSVTYILAAFKFTITKSIILVGFVLIMNAAVFEILASFISKSYLNWSKDQSLLLLIVSVAFYFLAIIHEKYIKSEEFSRYQSFLNMAKWMATLQMAFQLSAFIIGPPFTLVSRVSIVFVLWYPFIYVDVIGLFRQQLLIHIVTCTALALLFVKSLISII